MLNIDPMVRAYAALPASQRPIAKWWMSRETAKKLAALAGMATHLFTGLDTMTLFGMTIMINDHLPPNAVELQVTFNEIMLEEENAGN